ncbi:hypothetical protein AB0F17_16985 [Nonomuraea sp. NPDC026600]|uniref:hypothetical protein n=1 Tax=Nonomuraea sp. NPDC026600 TaxID=3155363 RepID=UPI0033CAB0E5
MTGPSILDTLADLAMCLTAAVVLVLTLVALYRSNLKRHPYTDCRRCQGTGERRSRLFAHSYGYCPDCTGTGRRTRLGVRLFNIR